MVNSINPKLLVSLPCYKWIEDLINYVFYNVPSVPNTPTSVAVIASDTSPIITVTWQPVGGIVSHYRLSLVPSAGGDETSLFIFANLETSYTFEDVQPSTEYDVTVTALARSRELEAESDPEITTLTTRK